MEPVIWSAAPESMIQLIIPKAFANVPKWTEAAVVQLTDGSSWVISHLIVSNSSTERPLIEPSLEVSVESDKWE